MKIKHQDLVIPKDNPFEHCKLDRKKYATVLTDVINNFPDGFVLAVNNEWGTGKTTFVKMWEQHLKNESFQTIYFNAWENDFNSNPLIAIMAELNTLTDTKNKSAFKSVVEKGTVLAKNAAPALAKALIKRYVVDIDEVVADTVENVTKGASEILEEQINEYANKKKTIIEFRTELEKFIKKTDSQKPLIFIIDELDRCRPDYAVEILEQMKHFFSVTGIVFILSIDKRHLAASVRGFYGSEQIDTDEYLRRFVDLEYSIPRPATKDFIKYLFEFYSFSDFFLSQQRVTFNELRDDAEHFLMMAAILFSKYQTTLRQQERIFALTRLILCSFRINEYTFPHVLLILVFTKVMKDDLFEKIAKHQLSLQELSDEVGDLMIHEMNDYLDLNLGFPEALLLWLYNNSSEPQIKKNLLKKDGSGNPTNFIGSKLIKSNEQLVDYFIFIDKQRFDHLKLDFLLNRINLTEPLVK